MKKQFKEAQSKLPYKINAKHFPNLNTQSS
jgi:hypothetical protein